MSERKPKKRAWKQKKTFSVTGRMKVLQLGLFAFAGILVLRLAYLQILQHGVYDALASGQRQLYQDLFPERGDILVHDGAYGEMPIATNRYLNLVWVDPRRIEDPEAVAEVLKTELDFAALDEDLEPIPVEVPEPVEEELSAEAIKQQVEGAVQEAPAVEEEIDTRLPSEIRYEEVLAQLKKEEDPYEPIERRVPDEVADRILAHEFAGVHVLRERFRHYPETTIAGHVTGFVSEDQDGRVSGKYGIEGYLDDMLAGVSGYEFAERDTKGRWISVGVRNQQEAEDGADVLLTLDRAVQYKACSILFDAVERYQADSGSLVILDPKTGAIKAMCGAPSFDPNVYNEVEDISVYNNQTTFAAYEPGSIFKPIIAAAALDADVITPTLTYEDTGESKIDVYTIRNSDLKVHGIQTMTEVLEKSLNTGMIFIMRRIGIEPMARYVHDFGFGRQTGIKLNSEVSGNIANVDKGHEIYSATSSYGQGITTTLLQMARAYGALANEGQLMKPYIVEEIRHVDGTVEHFEPEAQNRVISARAAQTATAMLVSVVESGHADHAAVPGYYIAGKTGTAQVANENGSGYKANETIASFVGYGPVRDPAFVIAVRIDHPRTSPWAASTAAPVFGEIARYLLQYENIPPER